jgi:hypothetical protein
MLPKLVAMSVAVAIGATSVGPVAAASAPQPGAAVAMPTAQDFSAVRKKRHGYGHGVPLAAFGAIAGTIAGIAAAERRREYYEGPYGYYAPGYVYEAPVAAPHGYAPAYGYHHYGHHGAYGHFGAAPQPNADLNVNPSPGR